MSKVTILLFLFFHYAFAQEPYSGLEDALATTAALTGPPGPASVNWIEEGKRYSYKSSDSKIYLFDPVRQNEELIFDPANHTFPSSSTAFEYTSFQWSKDFQFIVFRSNVRPVWRNSGYADYYLYNTKSKVLKRVAEGAYTAQLSPDGTKMGFERDGNLFVTDLASGNQKQLTSDAREFFYNGRFGWAYEEEWGLVQAWEWNAESTAIAFWQSDEREVPVFQYTDYEGFVDHYKQIPYPRVGDKNPTVKIGVVNISSSIITWMKVDCGEGYIPRIYWTADKNKLAVVHMNRKQNEMKLYFTDISTGEPTLILEEKSNAWLEVFSFGAQIMHFLYFPANTKEFFWKSERNGWSHVYRYDYTGKLLNPVTQGNWEVIKIVHMDYTRRLIYYTSTEASPLERQLYVVGFDGKGKKRLTTTPGYHQINFGGEYFIDTYSSVNEPKQVDLLTSDGKLVKKLVANDGAKNVLKLKQYSPKQLEAFTTGDGQRIDISIIKPFNFDQAKKYPLLVDVYGGPEHQSVYIQFSTDGWHQYLAQLGFVIIEVNNRGGISYGSKFKNAVYEKLGHYECYDFAEAAKYMKTKSWIDGENIFIQGHSYGGFTSAYSVVTYPDLYKAAIIASPVTDWRNYDAIYTERFMGLLPENKAIYDQQSVLDKVAKIKAKVLIVHSTGDDNVHVKNSMQLLSAMNTIGKDAEVRLYQKGGHGVAHNWESYKLLLQQYTDFLVKNNTK